MEPNWDKEDWARETIKLLSDSAIEKISPVDRFVDQPGRYLALKECLIDRCLDSLASRKTISLEDIFSRKQRRNESAKQYAQALRTLAGDTFSSDYKLKDIFHRGLASQELQPIEKLSFNSLVNFTDTEYSDS